MKLTQVLCFIWWFFFSFFFFVSWGVERLIPPHMIARGESDSVSVVLLVYMSDSMVRKMDHKYAINPLVWYMVIFCYRN